MPSQLHESHLLLFRNQPALAAELMRGVLGAEIPEYSEAREMSADLSDVQPAEYRADMVIQLLDGTSVFGIVLEVQLSMDERKRFVWPAYVATLRARLECPVCLLVVTPNDAVARLAARSIDMGGCCRFTPYVLGPSGVPIVTDEAEARANPELAVLSAMAHGRDTDADLTIKVAVAAKSAVDMLDEDRSGLYFDLIMSSLSEAARRALDDMATQKYEYQSDFAKRYVARGVEQGQVLGRVAVITRMLTLRFGELSVESQRRISEASVAELDAIAERLLTARTTQEALGIS